MEYQSLFNDLLSGDTSSLTNLISSAMSSMPGISSEQKSIINSLMSGDTSSVTNTLTDQMKSVFEDDAQVETVRMQFLENPELAESLGIPLEYIKDKKKWRELMQEGLKSITGDASDTFSSSDEAPSKLFGKSSAL